jgi:glucosamine--fructose-6-phosphate aminotransferase (isomerizing)
VIGSSIARECDRTIFTQAGPEISVASTKAYTAQVMAFAVLGLHIAQVQEVPGVRVQEWAQELNRMESLAEQCLRLEDGLKALAKEFKNMPLCFFLGRGADAFVAMEGALKLKEIAYIPTQEYPSGEMKHGPLALITEDVVSIFCATDPNIREKSLSNMKEVQARGGKVIAITTADDTLLDGHIEHVLRVPRTKFDFLNALLTIIPLQLFSYHVANELGCEIDQPRNLAKSVTVE